MSSCKLGLSVVLGSILLLVFDYAVASVDISVAFAPPMREVVAAPAGYMNCYDVSAGIYDGVWVNAHRVCEYNSVPSGDVWVAGYWGCYNYNFGRCARWNWFPARWIHHGYREYGVVWHDYSYYHRHGYYRPYPYRDRYWHDDRAYDRHMERHDVYRDGRGSDQFHHEWHH